MCLLSCSGFSITQDKGKASAIAQAESTLEEAGWDDNSIGQVRHDLLRRSTEDINILLAGSAPRVVAALKAFSLGAASSLWIAPGIATWISHTSSFLCQQQSAHQSWLPCFVRNIALVMLMSKLVASRHYSYYSRQGILPFFDTPAKHA